jgi:hypothetical protein
VLKQNNESNRYFSSYGKFRPAYSSSMTSSFTAQERIESVKAGLIAAMAGTVVTIGVLVGEYFGASLGLTLGDLGFAHGLDWLQSGVRVAIAIVSAFLFGATYRYVIRQDVNPHLKSGVVAAFVVVRALSQLEGAQALVSFPMMPWLPSLWILLHSGLLFWLARTSLDFALHRGWVKAFGST